MGDWSVPAKTEQDTPRSWNNNWTGSAAKDEKTLSWPDSKSWGQQAKSDSSAGWGAKSDSWGSSSNTKEDWDVKGRWAAPQKRSWGAGSEGSAEKRGKWWDEAPAPIVKEEGTPTWPGANSSGSWAPVVQASRSSAPMPGVPRTPMTSSSAIPRTPADLGPGRSIPRTPGDAFGGPANSIPRTPATAFGGPGTPAGLPGMPRTPAMAFGQAGVGAPMTPAAAFGSVGVGAPMTPAGAFRSQPGGMSYPMTPAASFAGGVGAPMTPAAALGQRPGFAPFTPAAPGMAGSNFRAPFTPALQPGTPNAGAPRTPAGLNPDFQPGTPASFGATQGRHSPSTPGGFLMNSAALLGQARPGGYGPGTPGRITGSAAMTPAAIRGGYGAPGTPGMMQQQNQLARAFEKAPMFSDGSSAPLKHAPRRKTSTGEKVLAPSMPARLPEQWKDKLVVTAGSKKKIKVVEEPVPDFDEWRKHHRRKERPRVVEKPSQVPYVPFMGVAPTATILPSKKEEMTPVPQGDMTPAPELPEGETPRLPPGETPRMPGVETPGFGAETPFPFGGDETPRVPHTPADGEAPWSMGMGSHGEGPWSTEKTPADATPMMGMGDATPPVMPMCPPRADLKNKILGVKEQDFTPQVPHGQETPMPDYMPGMETPLMPPGARADPFQAGFDTPGFATPLRGHSAATADMTPILGGARHMQDSLPKTGYVDL